MPLKPSDSSSPIVAENTCQMPSEELTKVRNDPVFQEIRGRISEIIDKAVSGKSAEEIAKLPIAPTVLEGIDFKGSQKDIIADVKNNAIGVEIGTGYTLEQNRGLMALARKCDLGQFKPLGPVDQKPGGPLRK